MGNRNLQAPVNTNPQRIPLVDVLKVVASQLIVLHHLVSYGPLSRGAHEVLPDLTAWLFDYGRIAVQVFIVISGFLAAKHLAADGLMLPTRPHVAVWRRYERLVLPFLAALAIGIGAAAVARTPLAEEWIPATPAISQLLAHVFLLQGLLGYDSLIAGAWYIAIDFQLFTLMVAVIWLSDRLGAPNSRTRFVTPTLVAILAMASLFYFNRDADWDNWAIYFFGSYAMGACAYWASNKQHSPGWFVVLALVVAGALLMDFRLRIAVALAVALTLGLARRSGLFEKLPPSRSIAYLGRISYSMFLMHFAVCLLANAAFTQFSATEESVIPWMLGTWLACIAAGALLFHSVENRIGRFGLGSLQVPLLRRFAAKSRRAVPLGNWIRLRFR